MKYLSVVVVIFLALSFTGCNLTSASTTPTIAPTAAPTLEFIQPTQPAYPTPIPTATSNPPTPLSADQAVLDRAAQVVSALKDKDIAALASFVHPQHGLRLSPYAAVMATDLVIPVDKVAGLMIDNAIYAWGAYQATGEPINLTFADYYAKFIYDVDFANAPQIALNHRLGVSTTLDNAAEFYPGDMIVEYYFPGFDPSLEGMDWRSLRLVFMQESDTWYLIGIIHDQWTT